jgi:hypothetical protein
MTTLAVLLYERMVDCCACLSSAARDAFQDNLGDDRALFDSVIASREYDAESNTTVTSLAELRPGNTAGSATNEAYWVPFNMTDRKLPRPLVVSEYENLGFNHFPRDDGVNPANPKSGWWRVINSRDMQEGDFCFSPIFVWKVNEPVTLKIHALVPVWRPSEGSSSSKERVGAYVVGFKLHFLAKYLKETAAEMSVRDPLIYYLVGLCWRNARRIVKHYYYLCFIIKYLHRFFVLFMPV